MATSAIAYSQLDYLILNLNRTWGKKACKSWIVGMHKSVIWAKAFQCAPQAGVPVFEFFLL